MEGNAVIEQYIGGYDDYLQQRSEQQAQKNKSKTSAASNKPIKPKTKLSYHEQRELNKLPEQIESLENSISIVQSQLADPAFYQNPDAQNLSIELSKMELELEQLYDKWGELDNG